ncbi:hypothetical protein KDK_53570 [Dictyobacter kobayashii]|uniref:Uncharacterized protein n=1 Tax=Dictyobacter kobayashii TaxID=2014872 RepID=A0A402AR40_9CHLR|nr:hypothetical protein KDK_53570 [Dictyobacter kobayashii]
MYYIYGENRTNGAENLARYRSWPRDRKLAGAPVRIGDAAEAANATSDRCMAAVAD